MFCVHVRHYKRSLLLCLWFVMGTMDSCSYDCRRGLNSHTYRECPCRNSSVTKSIYDMLKAHNTSSALGLGADLTGVNIWLHPWIRYLYIKLSNPFRNIYAYKCIVIDKASEICSQRPQLLQKIHYKRWVYQVLNSIILIHTNNGACHVLGWQVYLPWWTASFYLSYPECLHFSIYLHTCEGTQLHISSAK